MADKRYSVYFYVSSKPNVVRQKRFPHTFYRDVVSEAQEFASKQFTPIENNNIVVLRVFNSKGNIVYKNTEDTSEANTRLASLDGLLTIQCKNT